MGDGSSDELPIPSWVVLWCGFVAAALLVPARIIRRFIVDPMTEPLLQHGSITPEDFEQMRETHAVMMRVFAVGFALLYLLLRALTVRLRRDRDADA